MTRDPDLTQAILARAGDLVHHMTRKGYEIAVASGPAPNGVECAVIICTGDRAEMLAELGRRLAKMIDDERKQLRDDAAKN